MSSSEVEVHLVAYDEASDVIESVGSTVSTTFTDIEGNTQELASTTDSATGQMANDYSQVGKSAQSMSDSVDSANMSCSESAITMNSTAMSGAALFMSFENITNAEVSLDRAHLMIQKDTQALTTAQENYNAAVAKYGPNSQQATDAANKLSIAQDALTVAQERADMAQRNVTNSMIMAALTVIPTLVSVVNLVSNAESIWEGIQWSLNAAMDANPIGIICLAIVGLIAVIVLVYENCKPFRDILNEIGAVLGGALHDAVEGITVGLTWLWKNVFEPLGVFLAEVFMADIKGIFDVCNVLWNVVLKPFGEFLVGSFYQAWQTLGGIFEWFYNLAKPIIDAVNTAANALGGFVNDVAGAMSGAGKAIGGFISSICFAHALQGAADSSQKTLKDWNSMVSDSMNKGLTAIKDFNAQAQISGSPTLGGIGGAGPLPTGPSKPTVVNVYPQGPIVNVEGSADKATADLASKQVLQVLKTIIVEPSSLGAGITQKRIRQGSLFS